MGVKHIFEVLRNKKQETCIMRWYKKAAAVLLAAAMAVSMMTACGTTGGGNGGNGGNNGSKPGTSEGGDEKPDKPGASVIPADPAKVTWDTSLTKKCYNAVSADDFKVRRSCLEGVLLGMPLREKSSLWLIRKTRIR